MRESSRWYCSLREDGGLDLLDVDLQLGGDLLVVVDDGVDDGVQRGGRAVHEARASSFSARRRTSLQVVALPCRTVSRKFWPRKMLIFVGRDVVVRVRDRA